MQLAWPITTMIFPARKVSLMFLFLKMSCYFSHIVANNSCFATLMDIGRPLIVTHNGASGEFAGCTDLAYQQAVKDGADVIDCSVQMSKDGVAFCLDSPDLMGKTTAIASFMSRATMVPEIQQNNGIYSFDLTWSEIQSLKRKDF